MPTNAKRTNQHVPNPSRRMRGGAVLTICALCCLALCLALAIVPCTAKAAGASVTRPSTSGRLHVEGTFLVDEQGNHAVLRGVSTHGLTWYPQYVNGDLFGQLSDEWDCNLVRLALYSKDYCEGHREENLRILRQGIQACIDRDMYVLVDWHILEDNDPNINKQQALEFFELISTEYANVPNVLYEICNEPNQETTWSQVHAYATEVIPVIRQHSPQAVCIVGTPVYDRDLMSAHRIPLAFDNVMYTLHFYAATHGEDLRGELIDALQLGLPVFITECGLSEASGDGRVDFASAVTWFDLLAEHDLSYTIWNLSNKAETSAFIKPTSRATTHLDDDDLTPVGLWARSLIRGEVPSSIPVPQVDDNGMLVDSTPAWLLTLGDRGIAPVAAWPKLALGMVCLLALLQIIYHLATTRRISRTYDALVAQGEGPLPPRPVHSNVLLCQMVIMLSTLLSLVYLCWRVFYSVPLSHGWLAITGNLVLLAVEALGLVESLIHYQSMVGMRDHPLPQIADDEYPDVDIFIATYNEPVDLLRRTINGCTHLRYPDKSKVHVWVCDDNRRPEMRELAQSMGVGYLDRPDNKGAKAGNLNHALGLTSAPYVVTLDADMIVRSEFLLKTIPYFVDAEKRNARLPQEQRMPLGLLQTPQCFYDPDVFQHALYSETRATNEQDFFYRTIEVAKTSTNSVIYGGSNTVLSRKALEDVGGFYTESITEDFATGLLIESAGYVSLAIPEPLASGRTPHTYAEHIKQRTRWGRGVIVTAKKLHLLTRKGLSLSQRLSYWSSEVYWYSPIKNCIYLVSPLLFAVLNLTIFECSWLELLVYWLPMFVAQTLCLRVVSGNAVSTKWSGIHETSVMPHLLLPIIQEMLGITLSTFAVTQKDDNTTRRTVDLRSMRPFLTLLALSAFGIVRVTWLLVNTKAVGLAVLLFWLVRNSYYLLMSVFLIDGRDSDGEVVKVRSAELVTVQAPNADGTMRTYDGVATLLTEHNVRVYLDEAESLGLGERVELVVTSGPYEARLSGAVIGLVQSRLGTTSVHTIEILDFQGSWLEYLQILYDRIPTLPQTLTRDYTLLGHLWRNIAFRVARTVR